MIFYLCYAVLEYNGYKGVVIYEMERIISLQCPALAVGYRQIVSSPLWSEFCTSVEGTYGVSPRVEYSKCSMAPGWNVKYKKGGRSICTVYPNNGRFYCMLVIGDKKLHGAELIINSCGPYIQELFRSTSQSLGGKWLFIDVTSDAIVQDTLG